jgi:hypothetical protein
MHGANAERVSNSKELFYLFYDSLKESDLTLREELGGHSSVWALRAQKEGCKAFIAAPSNEVIERDIKMNDNLIWP